MQHLTIRGTPHCRCHGPPGRGWPHHLVGLVGLLERLQQAGTSIVELVCRDRPPIPRKAYPSRAGIRDFNTGCSFGYHVHEGIPVPGEVGHFHTLRWTSRKRVHLVGISMGADGWPRALFTTNLWAQRDDHRPAKELRRDVRRFRVTEGRRHVLVTRFVNLIFHAFLPEIERLQDEKARRIAALRRTNPDRGLFTDRSVHVLSLIPIDVKARWTQIQGSAIPPVHHAGPNRRCG